MQNKEKIFYLLGVICIIGLILLFLIIRNLNSIKDADEVNNNNDVISDDETNNEILELEEKDFDGYDTYNINLTNENDVVEIEKKGIYTLTGTLNGYIKINSDDNIKIILDSVNIKNDNGPSILVEKVKNIYIELVGESYLEDSDLYNGYDEDVEGTIYSKDDLFITGNGVLNIIANYGDGIVCKDDLTIFSGTINVKSNDDAIRGKDSVNIKSAIINIDSNGDGIKSTNLEDVSKGNILIENGEFNIISTLDGIQAENNLTIKNGKFNISTGGGGSITSSNDKWGYWQSNTVSESAKAIKAVNNIMIEDGEYNIDSSDDAIHSNGNIEISNGLINILSGDDGIHADELLTINGGTISIDKSYEGLEAGNIVINSGNISIVSMDDGINVAGGNDGSAFNRPGQNNFENASSRLLTINDGCVYVNASGDGLDSNGSIIMNDGTVIVDGPTDNGNAALDYDRIFTINGGILIATGSSGMAQNISEDSKQAGILINFSSNQSAGTLVNINDVFTYSPSKQFSSVLVSIPDLEANKTYTISLGGTVTGENINGLYMDGKYSNGSVYATFTVNGIVNNVGQMMNAGVMHGGPMRR